MYGENFNISFILVAKNSVSNVSNSQSSSAMLNSNLVIKII